jgi:uroporphyrinogen decarboxylase
MNSRERILTSLNHAEPDKVPFDLAGSTWTGITNGAYQKLRHFTGMDAEEPVWSDVVQQIVIPHEDMLEFLGVDTRGLFPLTSHNWDVYSKLNDSGDRWEYTMNGVLHTTFRKRTGTGFRSLNSRWKIFHLKYKR